MNTFAASSSYLFINQAVVGGNEFEPDLGNNTSTVAVEVYVKPFEKVVCTPIIMEKVCASGVKCFHDVHYLFETNAGCAIPRDACPLNCIVSNIQIVGVDVPVPSGGFPPTRVGECIVFTVIYTVRVFFEFTGPAGVLDVGFATAIFTRELAVPVVDLNGGCVLCTFEETTVCVKGILFDCIRALVVPRPIGFPASLPSFAIEVTVEKEIFAWQSGRSIVCLPTCVEPR